jgi:phosphate-selective porin
MYPAIRVLIFLACGLLLQPLHAQVSLDPAPEEAGTAPTATPLIFRNVPPETEEHGVNLQNQSDMDAVIHRMRELLRELAQASMPPDKKQAALDELIRDNHYILSKHRTWLDWQQPQTVESASLLLEQMIFEIAADVAPTEQSREQVLENAPKHLGLAPEKPGADEHFEPPLLEPVTVSAKRKQADLPTAQETKHKDASAPALKTAAINAKPPEPEQKGDDDDTPKVAVLVDDKATSDLHDDNTVLRDVAGKDGDLVLFGALHLWIGGALQYDVYQGEGLFTHAEGGNSDTDHYLRRGEGIFRASVFEHSEIKIQYDFDADLFRDLYWRWLSNSRSQSITVGNQKEPLSLDYLMGNKFATAMEQSAPSSAFYSSRSMGIRYNGWATLESENNPFPLKPWGDSRSHVTGSIGIFGEDIENTNDTDLAITGRISMAGNRTAKVGFQLGASASYRDGEFDRIDPRPGLQDANRIPLAHFEADTQALIALEGAYRHGSLHGQAELFVSDYSGGEVDAQGWGAYGQVGWLFGGKQRGLEPRWGQWAPINASDGQVFEVFARFSYSYGDDDINASNELMLLTLGGSCYYKRIRISANLILADTERDIADENSGHAIAARLQYLF